VSHSNSILLVGGGADASRLRRSLARRFLLVDAAHDFDEAAELCQHCQFHVLVVIDPRATWDDLRATLGRHTALPSAVLLIVDKAQAVTAIEAMRRGSADVLLRPFSTDELVTAIAELGDDAVTRARAIAAPKGNALLGDSAPIKAVRALIDKYAAMPATVLLEGEAGTGKKLIARLLHERSGRQGAFIAVHCGAVATERLAGELFGGARPPGAGRARRGVFVAARGGTLFVDEIDAMRLDVQARLLQVLDERVVRPPGTDRDLPVDCQLVAASRTDLAQAVAGGHFREDLYLRLNVMRIDVPPLRERPEDIPALVADFVDELTAATGLAPIELEPTEVEALQAHDWPGNVRELRNVVERALLLGHLPDEMRKHRKTGTGPPDYPVDWTLEQVKRHHMIRVLEDSGGNKSAAARRLDISRKTLERKLGAGGPERGSKP